MRRIFLICVSVAACSGGAPPGDSTLSLSPEPARTSAHVAPETANAPAAVAPEAGLDPHTASHPAPGRPETSLAAEPGPDIELRRLSDRVWLHVNAFELPDWGRVEANGLVIVGARGAVIIDTGWTAEQTRWLLDRARDATGRDALAVVATHSHLDRAGGAGVAAAAGVPVYASRRTRELLGAKGSAITHAFDATAEIDLGDGQVELFYPGAGHTPDNIVAFVREDSLLFGGCLVRAGHSDWIGNVEDADLPAWPATMDRVIERYGDARLVVPGHGRPGDASLLRHTRELAENAAE